MLARGAICAGGDCRQSRSKTLDEIRTEARPMILRLFIDDDDGRFCVAEFFGHELECDRLRS